MFINPPPPPGKIKVNVVFIYHHPPPPPPQTHTKIKVKVVTRPPPPPEGKSSVYLPEFSLPPGGQDWPLPEFLLRTVPGLKQTTFCPGYSHLPQSFHSTHLTSSLPLQKGHTDLIVFKSLIRFFNAEFSNLLLLFHFKLGKMVIYLLQQFYYLRHNARVVFTTVTHR